MHQLQHTLAQVSARGQCRFKHIRRCRGIINHHAHPEWALEEACCALPHTGLQYHTFSHSQRACSAAQQTAPQARSGDPARILSQFWRWTRRSSSPGDVWPPSQSRGAASAYLERRLHPSTSSSRKRTISFFFSLSRYSHALRVTRMSLSRSESDMRVTLMSLSTSESDSHVTLPR